MYIIYIFLTIVLIFVTMFITTFQLLYIEEGQDRTMAEMLW